MRKMCQMHPWSKQSRIKPTLIQFLPVWSGWVKALEIILKWVHLVSSHLLVPDFMLIQTHLIIAKFKRQTSKPNYCLFNCSVCETSKSSDTEQMFANAVVRWIAFGYWLGSSVGIAVISTTYAPKNSILYTKRMCRISVGILNPDFVDSIRAWISISYRTQWVGQRQMSEFRSIENAPIRA